MSSSERSNLPSSFSKIRRRATLPASRSAASRCRLRPRPGARRPRPDLAAGRRRAIDAWRSTRRAAARRALGLSRRSARQLRSDRGRGCATRSAACRLQRGRELVVAVRLLRAALLLERSGRARSGRSPRSATARAARGTRSPPRPSAGGGSTRSRAPRGSRPCPARASSPSRGNRRLRRHPLAEVGSALLEEVVRVAHLVLFRYGKFSSTKSSGSVKSRVLRSRSRRTGTPASIARLERVAELVGRRCRCRGAGRLAREQPERRCGERFAGSSSRTS